MKNAPLCSLCNKQEETPLHIFSECDLPLATVSNFFENNLILPALRHRLHCLGSEVMIQS